MLGKTAVIFWVLVKSEEYSETSLSTCQETPVR